MDRRRGAGGPERPGVLRLHGSQAPGGAEPGRPDRLPAGGGRARPGHGGPPAPSERSGASQRFRHDPVLPGPRLPQRAPGGDRRAATDAAGAGAQGGPPLVRAESGQGASPHALFDHDARERQLPAAGRLPRAHGAVLPFHHRRRGEPAKAVGGRRGGPGRDDERLRPLRAGENLRMSSRSSGFTYLEMVATAAILMILASAVLPMARVVRTRQKEIELRRSLRILRTAIDEYKKAVD